MIGLEKFTLWSFQISIQTMIYLGLKRFTLIITIHTYEYTFCSHLCSLWYWKDRLCIHRDIRTPRDGPLRNTPGCIHRYRRHMDLPENHRIHFHFRILYWWYTFTFLSYMDDILSLSYRMWMIYFHFLIVYGWYTCTIVSLMDDILLFSYRIWMIYLHFLIVYGWYTFTFLSYMDDIVSLSYRMWMQHR